MCVCLCCSTLLLLFWLSSYAKISVSGVAFKKCGGLVLDYSFTFQDLCKYLRTDNLRRFFILIHIIFCLKHTPHCQLVGFFCSIGDFKIFWFLFKFTFGIHFAPFHFLRRRLLLLFLLGYFKSMVDSKPSSCSSFHTGFEFMWLKEFVILCFSCVVNTSNLALF